MENLTNQNPKIEDSKQNFGGEKANNMKGFDLVELRKVFLEHTEENFQKMPDQEKEVIVFSVLQLLKWK